MTQANINTMRVRPSRGIILAFAALVIATLTMAFAARWSVPGRALLNLSGLAALVAGFSVWIALALAREARVPREVLWPTTFIVALSAWYASLGVAYGTDGAGLIRIAQLAAALILFVGAALWIRRCPGCLPRSGWLLAWSSVLALGAVLSAFGPLAGQINANSVGMVGFVALGVVFLAEQSRIRKVFVISIILLSLSAAVAVGARGALLAMMAFLVTYSLWTWLSAGVLRVWLPVFGAGIFSVVVVIALLNTDWWAWQPIDEWSREVFGRRVMSGRQDLWAAVLDAGRDRLWTGYGPSASMMELTGQTLSAHNLFIQVLLQSGIVGLSVLLLVLVSVWFGLIRHSSGRVARVGAGFFIGMVVLQSFEVALTQNLFVFGAVFWILMGLSVGGRKVDGSAYGQ